MGWEIVNQWLHQMLPKAIGYSDRNALVITDALGRTFTLPWDIVSTYEVRLHPRFAYLPPYG